MNDGVVVRCRGGRGEGEEGDHNRQGNDESENERVKLFISQTSM